MLSNLQIKNFLLIDELELDFNNGLTVITGETGSGKSIMIDALLLIFGAKANSEIIRSGTNQASFSATFAVDNFKIREWLAEREFLDSSEEMSVICRRVLDINGRSKAYINSIPVTLGVMKELGEMLLDIHTQHASIALLKSENQRLLVDEFAGISEMLVQLASSYQMMTELDLRLHEARESSQDLLLKQELLSEKVRELSELALENDEWESLQNEQRQLANATFILQELDFASNLIGGEQNSLADLAGTLNHRLGKLSEFIPNYAQISALSDNLEVIISELDHELQSFANKIEHNPERLNLIDERIGEVYAVARKLRILPEDIPEKLQLWQQELASLVAFADIEQLERELAHAKQNYLELAKAVSLKRQSAAAKLGSEVSQILTNLAIQGEFNIAVATGDNYYSHGIDTIQYLVSFNRGMALQPLTKVASGGELSRVALALYVTLSVSNPPELIVFDEIDVGIGGGVAEVVGSLLRRLGLTKQVICITHQPQTACCGNQHLLVKKYNQNEQTITAIDYAEQTQRIDEIARMLGGLEITTTTLQHAQEMLGNASNK